MPLIHVYTHTHTHNVYRSPLVALVDGLGFGGIRSCSSRILYRQLKLIRYPRLKNLPTMPLAMLPASPDVEKALPAILEAWLNLSHREKASELVMVRAIAIAVGGRGALSLATIRA